MSRGTSFFYITCPSGFLVARPRSHEVYVRKPIAFFFHRRITFTIRCTRGLNRVILRCTQHKSRRSPNWNFHLDELPSCRTKHERVLIRLMGCDWRNRHDTRGCAPFDFPPLSLNTCTTPFSQRQHCLFDSCRCYHVVLIRMQLFNNRPFFQTQSAALHSVCGRTLAHPGGYFATLHTLRCMFKMQ
jgi:hypothetical protein